jgi:hypothetical protein
MSRIFNLVGWHALLAIAGAIALAELFGAHRFIRRGLWAVALGFTVIGTWNTWRR